MLMRVSLRLSEVSLGLPAHAPSGRLVTIRFPAQVGMLVLPTRQVTAIFPFCYHRGV